MNFVLAAVGAVALIGMLMLVLIKRQKGKKEVKPKNPCEEDIEWWQSL